MRGLRPPRFQRSGCGDRKRLAGPLDPSRHDWDQRAAQRSGVGRSAQRRRAATILAESVRWPAIDSPTGGATRFGLPRLDGQPGPHRSRRSQRLLNRPRSDERHHPTKTSKTGFQPRHGPSSASGSMWTAEPEQGRPAGYNDPTVAFSGRLPPPADPQHRRDAAPHTSSIRHASIGMSQCATKSDARTASLNGSAAGPWTRNYPMS
jgi:hypothetical protein